MNKALANSSKTTWHFAAFPKIVLFKNKSKEKKKKNNTNNP